MALAMAWYVHFWPHLHTANESIRLYFAQAVMESGRPELDEITRLHGSVPVDRSEYGGHIYMDKAPGLSLLALPVYAVVHALRPQVRHDELWLFGYICCLVLLVAPLLLGLLAMFAWLRRGGASPREAGLALLATGLASPIFVYSTLLFGHGLAAALIMIALFSLRPPEATAGAGRRFGAGLAAGLAGLVDTPVFIFAAMLCLFVLARAPVDSDRSHAQKGWSQKGWQRVRQALPFVAGVALFAIAQLAYNHWTLGHPLRFTYQYKGDSDLAAIIDSGFFGFRPPSLVALWGTWLSPARGLIYHAPWLLVALLGLLVTAAGAPSDARRDARWLGAMVLAYGLLVSGFVDWRAGDSAGPRHLLPAIAPLAVGVVPGWRWLRDRYVQGWQPDAIRGGLAVAILLGLFFAALPVMTFPYHFHQLDHPVLELNLPILLFFGGHSHSVGNAMGLGHGVSAAVFLALMAAPWLLWLAWADATGEPARGPEAPRLWRAVACGLVIATVCGAALVAPIPTPERMVQAARFKATQLLLIPRRDRPAYGWLLRHRAP